MSYFDKCHSINIFHHLIEDMQLAQNKYCGQIERWFDSWAEVMLPFGDAGKNG